jgi:hypothetical protein
MRRDYIFWGAVLILLGGLMFLNNADIRLPGGINPMQLFWPSVLILLGGSVIFGYFIRGAWSKNSSRSTCRVQARLP